MMYKDKTQCFNEIICYQLVAADFPWIAVAIAGFCNFYSTRKGELVTGIQVKSPNGEEFGMSQIAAKDALTKACIARFSWTIPMFYLPLLFNACLRSLDYFQRLAHL